METRPAPAAGCIESESLMQRSSQCGLQPLYLTSYPQPRFFSGPFHLYASHFIPRPNGKVLTRGRIEGPSVQKQVWWSCCTNARTERRSSIAGLPCYQPPQLSVALRRQDSIGASRQLDRLVISLPSHRWHQNVSSSPQTMFLFSFYFLFLLLFLLIVFENQVWWSCCTN